ncbi:MAG: hypothetical protein ACRDT4_21585 [Micromonosporaceae bacterium]
MAALLTLGTCAALAVGGLVALLPGGGSQAGAEWPSRPVQAAVKVASDCVAGFLTISVETVGDDLDEVLACSTGEFREQYKAGMREVREAVVSNKVTSTGEVLRSGVVRAEADTVVVLLAVDAKVKNVTTPRGRQAHYRVQVDMTLVKDRWLVSKLEFVD